MDFGDDVDLDDEVDEDFDFDFDDDDADDDDDDNDEDEVDIQICFSYLFLMYFSCCDREAFASGVGGAFSEAMYTEFDLAFPIAFMTAISSGNQVYVPVDTAFTIEMCRPRLRCT